MEVAFIQGDTVELRALPKDYKNLLNFANRSESEWNENGFYRVIRPDLAEGEKYGTGGKLVGNEYVIEVVAKTPEEIANEAEQKLNSDVSQQAIDKRRMDGQLGYDRIVAIIERKYRNGEITANQAKGALQFFDPLIEALNRGQWIIVQIKMNAATVPAGYQDLSATIKNKVDSYIQTSY